MNVLLICNKSPWPAREGGPIAMNAMVEGLLNAGHRVKVIAINSYKYHVDIKTIPSEYRQKTGIELVFIDLRIRLLPALQSFLANKSYHVQRFIDKKLSTTIEKVLKEEKFDVIQLESLFIAPYLDLIRKNSDAPVVLRAHNIEHLIWFRLAEGTRNPLKKFYLKHLARTLKEFEIQAIKAVDGIAAITEEDAFFFENYIPADKIISIPFGIDSGLLDKYRRRDKDAGKGTSLQNQNAIFHLGSMNWIPNQEGIQWFLDKVWPALKQKNAAITLHLAGREMPEWLLKQEMPGVVIDGEVPDAIEYMHKFRIMVVPLLSGSGIRIKIIEGMMAGCAIVTTSIGAEGINCKDKEHLAIADTPEEFAEAIERFVLNPAITHETGLKAMQFIVENHNNAVLINRLESFYSKLLHISN